MLLVNGVIFVMNGDNSSFMKFGRKRNSGRHHYIWNRIACKHETDSSLKIYARLCRVLLNQFLRKF
jgi:hypothetical protein